MQRPVRGYRGGIRVGTHLAYTHRVKDENDDSNRLSLSNSSLDDIEDINDENNSTMKCKDSSMLTTIAVGADMDSAMRSLRSLTTSKKKNKGNPTISSQKADLPQLNMMSDKTNNLDDQIKDEQSRHWFPKPDIVHVNSNDFIRHNHVDSQQTIEQATPPALLTSIPPVGISARPTAIVAPAGPTRSISAFFSSNSSIKKANSNSIYDFQSSSLLKSTSKPTSSSLSQTASSAFHPINPIQNSSSNGIHQQIKTKSQSLPMDIPKHQPLKRGEKLTNVHISHPQSPSIIHLMLHEDFNKACRLLHKMAAHPELQSTYVPPHPFKPEINQICACFHEGRWFRCRIQQISSDCFSATVVYLDWGMVIPIQIKAAYIRHLPKEFYTESSCSIMCHLDDVPDPNDTISSDIIAQCIGLLSEDKYEVIVNDYHDKIGGKILLLNNERVVNDQIKQLLLSNNFITPKEELTEQFRNQLQLSIGDESKALLSSFSGKDDTFYVLIINDNTVAIDRAMSELQEDHIPNREYLQIPQLKSLVVARYAGDRRCYRAWVKSVDIPNEQALVFFVDFGNESKVSFSDIYICPETVRTLPWLGVRIRVTGEKITNEELTAFWKLTESHYIWIRVNEILKDSYGVQIKIDYTVYLRQERMKMSTPKRLIHKSVQTKADERMIYPSNSSTLVTPSLNDQSQMSNENLLGNLFEMINNELRSLRHRINDSDEASQDRHSQLMQLLFSIFNSNNSINSQKKI